MEQCGHLCFHSRLKGCVISLIKCPESCDLCTHDYPCNSTHSRAPLLGAVTCNCDNWPASVVTECCRLNCPLCHRNRRVTFSDSACPLAHAAPSCAVAVHVQFTKSFRFRQETLALQTSCRHTTSRIKLRLCRTECDRGLCD